MKNCTPKFIRDEIETDIGITNLGKYTFPNILTFEINVFDVLLKTVEKYDQIILPDI